MVDTVKLQSPPLPEGLCPLIRRALPKTIRYKVGGLDIEWETTGGFLLGSWDSRLRIRLLGYEVDADGEVHLGDGSGARLVIEGSPHKAIEGHNIVGGPERPAAVCAWFVQFVQYGLGVVLPRWQEWDVMGIHWAEVFQFVDPRAPGAWCDMMASVPYNRRETGHTRKQSVWWPGTWSTLKAYAKLPEFKAHDRARLARLVERAVLVNLEELAKGKLRVELELHSKRLRNDFGGRLPKVPELTRAYCEMMYETEVGRVQRVAMQEKEVVRTKRAVNARLKQEYGPEKARLLGGTWSDLAVFGPEYVREQLPRATFFRHLKALRDAGIVWQGSDLRLVEDSILPSDFLPILRDPRRLCGESDKVRAALMCFGEEELERASC